MKQDEAEKLARKLKAMFANGMRSEEHDMDALCDYILSGAHKRNIENAAFKRAIQQCTDGQAGRVIARRIRCFIQPPAQKGGGE